MKHKKTSSLYIYIYIWKIKGTKKTRVHHNKQEMAGK